MKGGYKVETKEAIKIMFVKQTKTGRFENSNGALGHPVTFYLVEGQWITERTLKVMALCRVVKRGR